MSNKEIKSPVIKSLSNRFDFGKKQITIGVMESMNKQIKQLDKVTACIDDGEIVFTLSGYLDKRDWEINIHFPKYPALDKSWRVEEYLSDEEEIEKYLKDEYIDFVLKYASSSVTIEKVDCEHDDEDVFPNEDDVNECDRCGAVLGN